MKTTYKHQDTIQGQEMQQDAGVENAQENVL